MSFDGVTYDPELDHDRLRSQLAAVKQLMVDGEWRTLDDISFVVNGSVSGISARLRDLRKKRFGSHTVERRRAETPGVFEYRLIVNT